MRIVAYRGKWAAYWRRAGKPQRISLGYEATPANRPLAERRLAEITRELTGPSEGATLDEIFRAYLRDSKAVRKDRQESSWKALKPHFGPLSPGDITRDKCRSYVQARRRQGRADGTIRKELADLRAAVRWHSPGCGAVFELPTPPPARDRWLTRKEFDKLLEAAKGTYHLSVFLHLAIATAGRKEALLTMKWDQVDFKKGEISLGYKAGGKARPTVPMTRTLRTVLLQARRDGVTDYVVEWAGQAPIKSIKRAWANALEKSGIPHCTIHDLRHTAAVWMIGAGVSMDKVSQYLGHSDIRVTAQVYARYQPDHLKDAAAALEV